MAGKGKWPRLVADKRAKSPAPVKKKAPKTQETRLKNPPTRGAVPRRRARPARRRHGVVFGLLSLIFVWPFRLLWGFTWRIGVVALFVLALAVFYVYQTLPPAAKLLDGRARGSVTLMDRNNDIFAWRGDQYGGAVTADSVSKYLKDAVVATEDKRFYRHLGVSPRGIASAVKINLSEGRGPLSGHGGSTITQQTAKLLCLGVKYVPGKWKDEADYIADCRRTTLWRKAKEGIYALAMEAKYSKDDILAIYLNRAYMGGGAYGAEAASERYFGKHASELSISEGAMLAGLLTAPSSLAPTSDIERSQNRANVVIGLMQDQGYISKAEAEKARANPAQLSQAAEAQAGGYFADWVMNSGPEFFTRDTTEDVIIQTTFDPRIQKAAEDALKHIFSAKLSAGSKVQAAIVVMSADGAVRGMVGGRRTKVSGAFNRATQASRQTGSAFKPFVYAAALDLGMSPNSTVVDEPYCIYIPGSGQWCPKNYTRSFKGPVTLTQALAASLNIPAVKVAEQVGLEAVRAVASGFGIKSDLAQGPALALGASECSLLELTGAFAGILNGGSAVLPYGLRSLRLVGESDPLMKTEGGIRERVISQKAAEELTYMMSRVIAAGTGTKAQLGDRPAAGKTGTTQAARDAWFVGFTAEYVVGVWMGNDDNTPLKGVTGGGLPAEIWRETMLRVEKGLPITPLPARTPEPVAPKVVEQPAPTPAQEPEIRIIREPRRSPRDNAIKGVLNDIFGADR